MKGKALRKHRLHEKKAALVLLKMIVSGNEGCHTPDAPYRINTVIVEKNTLIHE